MEVTESNWATRREYNNGITTTLFKPKTLLLDFLLRTGGAALLYSAGRLVGEGVDNIPLLQEYIPRLIQFTTGIDVQGNIDGLVGLLGGLYGLSVSGVRLHKEDLEVKEIALTPVHFYTKGNKGKLSF